MHPKGAISQQTAEYRLFYDDGFNLVEAQFFRVEGNYAGLADEPIRCDRDFRRYGSSEIHEPKRQRDQTEQQIDILHGGVGVAADANRNGGGRQRRGLEPHEPMIASHEQEALVGGQRPSHIAHGLSPDKCVARNIDQCAMRTGTRISRSTCSVAPPRIHSRNQEWP